MIGFDLAAAVRLLRGASDHVNHDVHKQRRRSKEHETQFS